MKEEVKKILEGYFSEQLGEGASDDIAEEIHNLYKLKLPENPYHPDPLREFDHEITMALRDGFNECLEQVKERNKELL